MQVVGIIAEYNPFHNGHIYHLEQVKKNFPDALIVLVLNGYFLERGEVSCLSKEDKTALALQYGVDLVLELPVIFGTQSADIFAEQSLAILNQFHVTHLVFGSECNDTNILFEYAKRQLQDDFVNEKKKYLKFGLNYPTAVSKAISSPVQTPNDLLGISYAKAILKHQYPISLSTILRTNDYHQTDGTGSLVSASTIRCRFQNNESIDTMVPQEVLGLLHLVDEDKLWMLLRYRILTEPDLQKYLSVDEGIESRLQKMALVANHYREFIQLVKTKRFTYNRIQRMTIHLLLGLTKQERDQTTLSYLHILGFNRRGQNYLKQVSCSIPFKPIPTSKLFEIEKRATYLYEVLTNSSVHSFEFSNRPIIKYEDSLFDKLGRNFYNDIGKK